MPPLAPNIHGPTGAVVHGSFFVFASSLVRIPDCLLTVSLVKCLPTLILDKTIFHTCHILSGDLGSLRLESSTGHMRIRSPLQISDVNGHRVSQSFTSTELRADLNTGGHETWSER